VLSGDGLAVGFDGAGAGEQAAGPEPVYRMRGVGLEVAEGLVLVVFG
jgi:hypothetical protein